jgi:23S rRNA (cytidine1920-2'-O)/16S rRNA (cytidine1409-2'-O)-methyltransferase
VAKQRLDQMLVERGLAESRTKAQALIMAGLVYTGERRLDSAGTQLSIETEITVRGQDHPWVSRGGLKLAHGLAHFGFAAKDRVAVDVGASTGGFTDVLLTNGAAKVYAVDVGYGQLAHKLRTDARVVVLERTNARHLTAAEVPEPVTALVCDASFIGLRTVLPAGMALCAPGAWLIALIKPQFEVGRENVGKKGVVRDPALHQQVCDDIAAWLGAQDGWTVRGITPSPITGPEGNVEFLIGAEKA